MARIPHLGDLRYSDDPTEQDFVDLLVASRLEVHPDKATEPEWDRAWRLAQSHWEVEVERFRLHGSSGRSAEVLARNQLLRGAMHRLRRNGWTG